MSSRLDEIKARAEAATKGPWSDSAGDGYGPFLAINSAGATVARCDYGPYEGSRDAEFVAHARSDVPALVAAVEEVLELHKPAIWPPSSFSFDDPTATRCKGCARRYPCPTVQAINTALGEGQK